jgi:N4-(beta-N-acetylglucosaminyl)-L-asparaginase
MSELTRRDFIQSAAVAAAAGALTPAAKAEPPARSASLSGPVVISSGNGLRATEKAAAMILKGADTLDAVIAGVNIVEEDPEDTSVGYGGLPNEDGVVELDSCVMHGPTCRAGAVAALRNIKTPSKVAKLVMERTDHVMLVGEGALRFARIHGFEEVNLLTPKARQAWLEWKEAHSNIDDWIAPPETPGDDQQSRSRVETALSYGTITCCALSPNGSISGVTTTSGLSFKIPGRVGDSPIIGAGLYVDKEVGAAGSTGRGEAVIKICGTHTIVEAMRHGMSPVDACRHALERIVQTTEPRLHRKKDGRPAFDVKFYALSIDGRHGAASIWSGAKYAVFADGENKLEDCDYLYERPDDMKNK